MIDVEKVFHQKEALFLELRSEMKLIGSVVAFARQAVAARIPVSVASGGPRDIVRHTLELMHLQDLFPVVVTPEDVAQAIAVLSDPRTHWITGNPIGVDGAEDIVG